MDILRYIFCDWQRNRGNPKGRILLIAFRIASIAARYQAWRSPAWFFFLPYLLLYRIMVEWILNVEIPYKTKIGPGLRLFHGAALVINDNATIGANVTLRHCTTIGEKKEGGICPNIGDGVDIGSNSVVLGDILVGDESVIGAGSTVIHSFESGSILAGNPARIIRTIDRK